MKLRSGSHDATNGLDRDALLDRLAAPTQGELCDRAPIDAVAVTVGSRGR